jgi:hypothetical protein
MHIRTYIERDPELRTEFKNRYAKITRTGHRRNGGILVEERKAAVADKLDDTATVILDACCRGGVEAVDELRERRGFERSDRTGEPGKIGDQEHTTRFASRQRGSDIAGHVAHLLGC